MINKYKQIGIEIHESGNRWKALCPFHIEKTPSFVVYPDATYHCFGCGKHGSFKTLQKEFGIGLDIFPIDSIDIETVDDGASSDTFFDFIKSIENKVAKILKGKSLEIKISVYDYLDRMKIEYRFDNNPNLIRMATDIKSTIKNLIKGGTTAN